MSATTEVRVLPADVFDALELSALVFGGIGAGSWNYLDAPLCIVGHAVTACGHTGVILITDTLCNEMARTAPWLRECERESDTAVRAINRRRRHARDARVSFADWCAELSVVRGAS